MTRPGALLRIALLAVTALLPLSFTPAVSTTAVTPETTFANQVLQGVNAERAERGRDPLVRSACLKRFAVAQAEKMARQERMSHQPSLLPMARACDLSAWSENVAFTTGSSGAPVVAGWMASSAGHRETILNRRYRQSAVGAARSDSGHWYVAQVFGRRS